MALPTIKTAIYELTIPSSKKTIRYRPFLVKEQKALLIAQQSENSVTMLHTLKDIINSCTFDELNLNELASFDLEYIFVNIRAKSVGEFSDISFSCLQCKKPEGRMNVRINLEELKVKFPDELIVTNEIQLNDTIGVKLKYPSIDLLDDVLSYETDNSIEALDRIMVKCIDIIYDAYNVYAAKDYTEAELLEFINSLTQDQFVKLRTFFDNLPVLEHHAEFVCPACGYEHSHTFRGMYSFF